MSIQPISIDKNRIKIFIASDHAGFEMKQYIINTLEHTHNIFDLGTDSTDPCDYPIFAYKLSNALLQNSQPQSHNKTSNKNTFGILICGTGIGMSIAANRKKGIRAALCLNKKMAKVSRKHNNANVIILGARLIDHETAIKCIMEFIMTDFDMEKRHCNRLQLIDTLN